MEFSSIVCYCFFIWWWKMSICVSHFNIYVGIRYSFFAISEFIWETMSPNTVLPFVPFDTFHLLSLTTCRRAGCTLCNLNWTVPMTPCSHSQSTIRINTMKTRNYIQQIRFDPIRYTLLCSNYCYCSLQCILTAELSNFCSRIFAEKSIWEPYCISRVPQVTLPANEQMKQNALDNIEHSFFTPCSRSMRRTLSSRWRANRWTNLDFTCVQIQC